MQLTFSKQTEPKPEKSQLWIVNCICDRALTVQLRCSWKQKCSNIKLLLYSPEGGKRCPWFDFADKVYVNSLLIRDQTLKVPHIVHYRRSVASQWNSSFISTHIHLTHWFIIDIEVFTVCLNVSRLLCVWFAWNKWKTNYCKWKSAKSTSINDLMSFFNEH